MAFRRVIYGAVAFSSTALGLNEVQLAQGRGAIAQLSEAGYQDIASMRDAAEMETFVRRVVEKEGMEVTNEHHLKGMTLHYSGHCAKQSFDALVQEVRQGQQTINTCSKAWVAPRNHTAPEQSHSPFLQRQKTTGHPNFFSWLFGSITGTEDALGAEEPPTVDGMHIGMFASLDGRGYQAVAATQAKAEMAMFVHRFLKERKLRVVDEGALQAVLPYHDGECGTKTFGKLEEEIQQGIMRPKDCYGGPWLEFEK